MQTLTKERLLSFSEEDYMNEEQLLFFKQLLLALKSDTMKHVDDMKKTLSNPPEINDDVDRAQYEEDSRLTLRILDRERKLLIKIDKSLKRIANKDYGYCMKTGEPIGLQRLLIRPVSEYCADVKIINEGHERHFAKKAR